MKLSGLYSAIVAAGSSIRLVGKKARRGRGSRRPAGTAPGRPTPVPVRSAIAAPIAPKATAESGDEHDHQSAPRTPSSIGAPKISPIAMNQTAMSAPSTAVPASRPSTIAKREIGAASRRSVNPISMSTASAIAAAVARQQGRLDHRSGEHEVEEAVDLREPGQVRPPLPGAAGLDRQQQGGEDHERGGELGAAQGLANRARDPAPATTRALAASGAHSATGVSAAIGSSAGVRPRPPGAGRSWRRRRRRGVGWTRSSDSTAQPGLVEGADHGRRPRRPRARARPGACRLAPGAACRSARGPPRPGLGGRPSASASSRWGRPIWALSALGVPSATRRPGGDDPDPVGELVGLLQVLGGEEDGGALLVQLLDLLPDRLAADRVEAGGRLVEEQHPWLRGRGPRRGRAGGACRPSRSRPGGRPRGQPDPVEQRSPRRRPWRGGSP